MAKSLEELNADVKEHETAMTALLDARDEAGEWTAEKTEKVGSIGEEIKKARQARDAKQAEIDAQGKRAAEMRTLMGIDSSSGTDGAFTKDEEQQINDMFSLDGNAPKHGQPTFRNGMEGKYTALNKPRVNFGDNYGPLRTDVLASKQYTDAWAKMIDRGNFDMFPEELRRVKAEEGCFGDNCGTVMNPNDYFQGGFMINPVQFLTNLQRCCDNSIVMRQWANVRTIASIAISIPVLVKRLQSFAWGCECEPPRKSDIPEGDRLTLKLHQWTQMTGTCDALMKFAAMDPEGLLLEELAYDLSRNLERAYLYGPGQEGPLGVLNRLSYKNAIAANPDKVHTIKKGLPSVDCLLRLFCNHSCPGATLLMSKKMWCQLMEMKNGNGDYYFWNILLSQGVPGGSRRPNLLGVDVYVSDEMTGDFEVKDPTDRYAAVLGRGSSYWILDGPATETARDTNIYNQRTCWVVRGYAGGGVVNDCDLTPIQIV